jgi:pyruvate kinase
VFFRSAPATDERETARKPDREPTSLLAAREHPAAPIVSMTPSQSIARRLAPVWGVHSVRVDEVKDIYDMIA